MIKIIITSILDIINPKRIYIGNLYKSNFSKNVLISYITYPFFKGLSGHSNTQEVLEIARIFNELEYNVDIINYSTNIKKIKFLKKEYSIVFGLEPNFIKLIKKFNPQKSIYYATGSHFYFQNKAEQKRIESLNYRKKSELSSVRYVKPHDSSLMADAVICIGNRQTKETYRNRCNQIECIRVSAYSYFPFQSIINNKNWNLAKKNFLWFGSSGAVHKGLDILLDIFKETPNINLFIAGNIKKEKSFMSLYSKELFNLPNIFFKGFINPHSESFKKLMNTCGFVVMPSCSEGMSSSVATCMHAGLIPIISKETGIGENDIGIILKKNSHEIIKNEMLKSTKKEAKWIENESKKSYDYAKNNFTIKIFSNDFKKALIKIL